MNDIFDNVLDLDPFKPCCCECSNRYLQVATKSKDGTTITSACNLCARQSTIPWYDNNVVLYDFYEPKGETE